MHLHLTHKRLQHGIGQGGFHSAKVRVQVRNESAADLDYRFDYVYDCGAVSFGKKSLLMNSIVTLPLVSRADSAGRKVLDALVLSHYDQDHMVGAKHLTSLYDVRRIYLPYLSPTELPLVLASQAERWRPMQIRALHRLATGGGQLFGVNVSMVGPTICLPTNPFRAATTVCRHPPIRLGAPNRS
jgi:glyoxylase-like metal-dependent hydrolase (beta-lactamase superfamily II)